MAKLDGGGGGGCPVLTFAITPGLYVDDAPAKVGRLNLIALLCCTPPQRNCARRSSTLAHIPSEDRLPHTVQFGRAPRANNSRYGAV